MFLNRANLEEQYFLNRQDRYWLLNDAAKLCDFLEDSVAGLLSSSDRSSKLDTNDQPFGYDSLKWKNRTLAIKTQERMASYLASKLVEKSSSAGEMGVIESRIYEVGKIEDKSQNETTLQVRGRETFKEKLPWLIQYSE